MDKTPKNPGELQRMVGLFVTMLIMASMVLTSCTANNNELQERDIYETNQIPTEVYNYIPIPGNPIGSYDLFKMYESAGDLWWHSTMTDGISKYAWAQSLNVWNSYLSVYESTGETIWLEKLSSQIEDILAYRDFITGKEDWRGYTLPSWSYTSDPEKYGPYHHPVVIGLLVYPMLRFAEVVEYNQEKKFYDKAEEYYQAALDALSVLDYDVWEYNTGNIIPEEACLDLWREETESSGPIGYYVGHLYYADPYFMNKKYVPDQMLPYNQSLSVAMCYPVLYRLTKDHLWLYKTELSWNWLREDIIKDDTWWWYYSRYYNWNREYRIISWETEASGKESSFYEDYEGHYSVDLMFIIEAHKIGLVSDDDLHQISKNKIEMGLSCDGWRFVMNGSLAEDNNIKAAVYFDYFALTLDEPVYREIIYPVLSEVIMNQKNQNDLASMESGINGTCLRLLASSLNYETCSQVPG